MKFYKGIWDTFFPKDLAYRRIFILVSIWILAVVLNYTMHYIFEKIGTPICFPFSVFGLSFQASGIPYAIMFILVLYFTIRHTLYCNIFSTYILGISLIVLGNMSLGNIGFAFVEPITIAKLLTKR